MTSLEGAALDGWTCPEASADGVVYLTAKPADVSYPEEGFEVLGLEGGRGFWFDHRARAVIDLLDTARIDAVWDVGAGTGSMSVRLEEHGLSVVAVEPHRLGAKSIAHLGIPSFCGTLEDLQLPAGALPAIGMFDVLEHLEHPADLLAEVHRVLEDRGVVVVTVPAHPWLWGEEDEVVGHFRRYTRGTLRELFADCGFEALQVQYLFSSLVPLAGILRAAPYRLGRRRSEQRVHARMKRQLALSPRKDALAARLLHAESAIHRAVPLPFGLSLVGLFAKI